MLRQEVREIIEQDTGSGLMSTEGRADVIEHGPRTKLQRWYVRMIEELLAEQAA